MCVYISVCVCLCLIWLPPSKKCSVLTCLATCVCKRVCVCIYVCVRACRVCHNDTYVVIKLGNLPDVALPAATIAEHLTCLAAFSRTEAAYRLESRLPLIERSIYLSKFTARVSCKSKPNRSQIQAKSKPNRSQIKAISKPNPSQIQAKPKQSPSQIKAKPKPNPSITKAKSKPNQSQIKAKSKPKQIHGLSLMQANNCHRFGKQDSFL